MTGAGSRSSIWTSSAVSEPVRVDEFTWELPPDYRDGMRVPGRIFATEELFAKALEDRAAEQVANMATLPGIVGAACAMPDIHWGYGFPIGGVAATHAVAKGAGWDADLERAEDFGARAHPDPSALSERALGRGRTQLGSLGGGNHFLEVQVVDEIRDPPAAEVLGMSLGQVCVMIHSGSRGLGHQACTD